ncbi:pirin-like C-terminal cupin domain-containing protein, partial [Rhizobium ruizarguesonis]
VYVLSGEVVISGDRFAADQLLVFRPGDAITLEAGRDGCHLMLFGGAALNSKRYIWWNFVTGNDIEAAAAPFLLGLFDTLLRGGDE